jgi:hypothetical protein
MFSYLKKLLGNRRPALAQRAARSKPPGRVRLRPALEALEDRQLLSAAVTAAAGIWGMNQSYVLGQDGSLALYQDSTLQSQIVSPTDASVHGGIAQVSAGVHGTGWQPASAPFVRFGDGTVNEYYRSGSGWSSSNICGDASEISASQLRSDTVFVIRVGSRFGGLWENVADGSAPPLSKGWVGRWGPQPGSAPPVSHISAGREASGGREAVFFTLGDSLFEGADNGFWWDITNGVSSFSASQIEGDTVFVIKSGTLYKQVGSDDDPIAQNGHPAGAETYICDNVAQVSAGKDGSGHAAAFILKNDGTLYEHTGTDANSGWTTIASHVTALDAAQGYPDTVYYTAQGYPGPLSFSQPSYGYSPGYPDGPGSYGDSPLPWIGTRPGPRKMTVQAGPHTL